MKYIAIINNGAVIEVLPELATVEGSASPVAIADRYSPEFLQMGVECPADVRAGWTYADGVFAPPVPPAQEPLALPMWKIRVALHKAGKTAAVAQAVSAAGELAGIEWEYATTMGQADPLLVQVATAIGVDLGDLFASAASL